MAATDIVPTHQKPLAFQGASTDGKRMNRSCASIHLKQTELLRCRCYG